MKKVVLAVVISSMLAGCVNPASQYRADAFDTSLINQAAETKVIEVLNVSKGTVYVDNSTNQKKAAQTLAILGAIAGAAAGSKKNSSAAVAAGAGGAALGAAAGNMVSDKVEAEGVLLSYSMNGKILTIAQVGEPEQFKVGRAMMVQLKDGSDRIMPNNPNYVPKKK
ncbi:MAG: hypothetical protein ACRCYZ_04140 [Alphaproteobacteria bacterium]